MSTLHIVDGTALLFRAYFGRIDVEAPDGLQVGGVLGMTQSFAKFLREVRPTHVAVVFDAGPTTFRNRIDPQYKANRGAPPDDLIPQFDLAKQAVRELGAQAFELRDYEADDLMATLARWAVEQDGEAVLVGSDKDLCQLVRDGVRQMHPGTFEEADVQAINERFGVRHPRQLVCLQALCGDSTDNVPGVRGVGKKTAAGLLQAFDDLDAIYDGLDRIPELSFRGAKTLPDKLAAARQVAYRSRQLVRLRDDVPMPQLDELTWSRLRFAREAASADAFFDRLGFHAPLRTVRELLAGPAVADGDGAGAQV